MKVVILDNGHGGMINGVYQTAGKRSPNWEKGVLYEGVFNRLIIDKVADELERLCIPYIVLVPELEDISLATRIERINKYYAKNKNVWLFSQHANAGGGRGFEAFTTIGQTKSDDYAEIILTNLETDFPEIPMRYDLSDRDKDKESDFYILKKSKCPAVLVESLFMDNKEDYNLLWSEVFQDRLVKSYVKSIKKIYESK
jgi:N-acetylmuramoyl-L-alanine amidase